MPEVIDTAYVRIRPTTEGFREEAASQISRSLTSVQTRVTSLGRASDVSRGELDRFGRGLIVQQARALGFGRALTFASTAFLGGAGISAAFNAFVNQASRVQEETEKTSVVFRQNAREVQAWAKTLSLSFGVSEGAALQAAGQFGNMLVPLGIAPSKAAVMSQKLVELAADMASFNNVSPGEALQAIQSGLAGQVEPLRRFGVQLSEVRLKQQAMTDGLFKGTGVLPPLQKALAAYEIILRDTAIQQGDVARNTGSLSVAQSKLTAELQDAEATIGAGLRPVLTDLANSAARYIAEANRTGSIQRTTNKVLEDTRSIIHGVQAGLSPIVAGFRLLSNVAGGTGRALKLAAEGFIAYKTLGILVGVASKALGVAGVAQGVYARAAAAATGANVAEAASARAVAASTSVMTSSLATSTVALRGVSTAAAGVTAANASIAASEASIGIAARAAAVGLGAGRFALAAIGGVTGAAIIATAGLAFGLYKLNQRAKEAAGTFGGLKRAVDEYDQSVRNLKDVKIRLVGAQDAVEAAKQAARAAATALTQAQVRVKVAPAAAGSIEQLALAERLRVARENLQKATAAVTAAERRLAQTRTDEFQQQQEQPAVIARTTARLLEQIQAIRGTAVALTSVKAGAATAGVLVSEAQIEAVERFRKQLEQLQSSTTGPTSRAAAALAQLVDQFGRLPTKHEIEIAVTAARGNSVAQVLGQLGLPTDLLQREKIIVQVGLAPFGGGVLSQLDAVAAARKNAADALGAENKGILQQQDALHQQQRLEEKTLATRKQAAATARRAADSARLSVANALDSLTSAEESLANAQRTLADTILQGQQAVNQSVRDAKTNLRTIGDSIAEAIGQFADQSSQKLGTGGPLAKRFRELRDEILAGKGGPETQRAAQRLAAQAQALSAAGGTDAATKAKQRIADLTDAFNRGKIGSDRFSVGLRKIIADFNLTIPAYRKAFGSAAANELRDQIAAAFAQAQAIVAGPRRPGGGQEPNIVKPLETVAQVQRDTRDATRSVEKATRDVAKAQRELQAKQYDEERKSRLELQKIRAAVEQQLKVNKTAATLNRPKPRGEGGAGAGQTAGAGAGAP